MARIDKINEEVVRALSASIANLKDPRITGIVSVTRCDVSNDLKIATAYISVLGNESEKEGVMAGLSSASGYIRKEVASKVNLRYTPKFVFKLDDSITHGSHIISILKKIDGGE